MNDAQRTVAQWLSVVKLLKGVATVVGAVCSQFLRVWVLTMLWAWYAVPVFGIAPLRMIYAFGLLVLVAFIKVNASESKATCAERLASSFLNSLLALGLGWIGHLFV